MTTAIVVPTVREEHIARFLAEWRDEFRDLTVYVVEDHAERQFDVAAPNVCHVAWSDIEADLGDRAWIIPHHSGCIRSYGCYLAYRDGAETIITLDDDCYPLEPGFVETHLRRLAEPAITRAWVSTISGLRPRGTPYRRLDREAECVVNHGLWRRIPDLDAVTQIPAEANGLEFDLVDQVVPQGTYYSMSSMNVAFRREVTPAMYFLPMGRDWEFDRYGDIWGGVFVKRICDHLRKAVRSGPPAIDHQRASNVWVNLRKEANGYETNEELWQAVDSLVLTGTTFRACYLELADKLSLTGPYWDRVRVAMRLWAELFPDAA